MGTELSRACERAHRPESPPSNSTSDPTVDGRRMAGTSTKKAKATTAQQQPEEASEEQPKALFDEVMEALFLSPPILAAWGFGYVSHEMMLLGIVIMLLPLGANKAVAALGTPRVCLTHVWVQHGLCSCHVCGHVFVQVGVEHGRQHRRRRRPNFLAVQMRERHHPSRQRSSAPIHSSPCPSAFGCRR